MKRAMMGVLLCATSLIAQTGAKNGEWRTYGGDLGNTHYSPLDQINAGNFNKLEVAWRFKTENLGPQPEFNLESTPLMANGVVYSTAGTRRAVVALDAATGELLWTHSENEGERGKAALRRMNQQHARFQISNDDFLYVLNENPGEELRSKVQAAAESAGQARESAREGEKADK